MKRLARYIPIILIPAVLLALFMFFGSSFLAGTLQAASVSSTYVGNGRDGSFTIAWTTDTASTGSIDYGTTTALGTIADDVRGSGYSGETHYVDLSGLTPSTLYYYDILSGGDRDNNGGAHYTFTTGPTLSIPVQGSCSYGQVFLSDGTTPAEGAIVKVTLSDNNSAGSSGSSAQMLALVDANGYWYACFNNSRETSLANYFTYDRPGDNVTLEADGASEGMDDATLDVDSSAPAEDLILGAEVCRDVSVVAGWNMTSIPVESNDMTLGTLLPEVVAPAYYFTSSYQAVNLGDAMQNGVGYWTYFNEPHTYQLCGRVIKIRDIAVNAGWNMVGPFEESFAVNAITSTPSGILVPPVYGFNNSYLEVDTLLAGDGYWIYASDTGTLHLEPAP